VASWHMPLKSSFSLLLSLIRKNKQLFPLPNLERAKIVQKNC
jgi:hypothetical protein